MTVLCCVQLQVLQDVNNKWEIYFSVFVVTLVCQKEETEFDKIFIVILGYQKKKQNLTIIVNLKGTKKKEGDY